MRRGLKIFLGIFLVSLIAIGAFVLFAPRPSTVLAESPVGGDVVLRGAFHDGLPGHHASGTIKIVRSGAQFFARFENYSATPGPEVYIFLTPDADARTADAVEGPGLQLHFPLGAGDGQATLRGDFNLALPAGFDATKYRGAVVWCKTYDAYFGGAPLV